jgi:hypothetical protein
LVEETHPESLKAHAERLLIDALTRDVRKLAYWIIKLEIKTMRDLDDYLIGWGHPTLSEITDSLKPGEGELDKVADLLRADWERRQQGSRKEGGEALAMQYVDLDQMAAAVNHSKSSLEKRKHRNKNPLPDPDIQGGGGKKDEWLWQNIRPWLETEFGRRLPDTYPRLR